MTLNAMHHNDHQGREATMYSPSRRTAKVLAGVFLAAGVASLRARRAAQPRPAKGRLRNRFSAGSCPMSRARL